MSLIARAIEVCTVHLYHGEVQGTQARDTPFRRAEHDTQGREIVTHFPHQFPSRDFTPPLYCMMSEINVDTASSTAHRLTVSSIRGVTARRGSSLSFHDLDIIVQDKEKQILHSVAGSVQPGEMLAIMGASGK